VDRYEAGQREKVSGILMALNVGYGTAYPLQVEEAFGVEKENHHFRRFLIRGKAGVMGELLLLYFGYNVNKLHGSIEHQDTTESVWHLAASIETDRLNPAEYNSGS
jgi:hypothetical protein